MNTRIKELREHCGLSQQDLAQKLKVGRTTLSHYETGRRNMDAETAKKIADIFGVSLDEIYGYTPSGNKKSSPAGAGNAIFLDRRRDSLLALYDAMNEKGRAALYYHATLLAKDEGNLSPDMVLIPSIARGDGQVMYSAVTREEAEKARALFDDLSEKAQAQNDAIDGIKRGD